jgi:sigma-B regulation protein RsbU (phosphoserine phosphatase)
VPKNIPDYLKLHVETSPSAAAAVSDELSSIELLCCAFERATGWHLRYDARGQVASNAGASAEENGAGLVLSPARRADGERYARLPREEAEHLATALAIVLGDLERTRAALREREAELAAGVPIAVRSDETQHLAERLEASLQAGVEAIGATAAALYVLDEGTSELKLRAAFNLPGSRLLEGPRPLRGAIADLEALLGHAVVIEDTALLPHWRCPEDVPSAMCVPVSSPNTPLGTLWIYSNVHRDFTPTQTNVIEVVAGRIASDLEREMLLSTGAETKSLERHMHEASRWQEEHLPTIEPLIDDYQVAGGTQVGAELASEFFDWTVLPDGNLAVAIGDAHGRAVTAGLSSAALHSALKAHSGYNHDARQMLERVNETLWTSSPGGQYASLFYGLISPTEHVCDFASAGRLGALLVQSQTHRLLSHCTPPLGSDPDFRVEAQRALLTPGGVLLLASDGVLAATAGNGLPWNEAALAAFVRKHLHLSAAELVSRLQTALGTAMGTDRTLLVVKRLR